MIVFDDVSRSFGPKWAVRDLTLDVGRGEVFGLLGPNGAGKTTAIRMMTGLLMPTRGRVLVAGHDIVEEPVKAKSLTGYVPDRAFFYEKLTVREFLGFVASIYGLDGDRAEDRVRALSRRFGLADIEDSFIEGCSQGMRQRLLFASALLHEPRVLVVDEPIVGLDPFGVALVKDIMAELSASGTTVFLATHSLPVAADLCHRVGLIERGRLVALKGRDEIAACEGGLEGLFLRELSDGGE